MTEYYLYTFESTIGAIATDKLLKPVGAIIMPVPRNISASCGMACRIEPDKFEESIKLFKEGSMLEKGEYTVYHVKQNKDKDEFWFEKVSI